MDRLRRDEATTTSTRLNMKCSQLLIVCLVVLSAIFGQSSEEDNQALLTKSHIDRILENISTQCRTEMESALDSQMEVSERCKVEIQTALTDGFPGQLNTEEGTIDPLSTKMKRPPEYKEPPPADVKFDRRHERIKKQKKGTISPVWYIVGKCIMGFDIFRLWILLYTVVVIFHIEWCIR